MPFIVPFVDEDYRVGKTYTEVPESFYDEKPGDDLEDIDCEGVFFIFENKDNNYFCKKLVIKEREKKTFYKIHDKYSDDRFFLKNLFLSFIKNYVSEDNILEKEKVSIVKSTMYNKFREDIITSNKHHNDGMYSIYFSAQNEENQVIKTYNEIFTFEEGLSFIKKSENNFSKDGKTKGMIYDNFVLHAEMYISLCEYYGKNETMYLGLEDDLLKFDAKISKLRLENYTK
jgi:hypothetical protein